MKNEKEIREAYKNGVSPIKLFRLQSSYLKFTEFLTWLEEE